MKTFKQCINELHPTYDERWDSLDLETASKAARIYTEQAIDRFVEISGEHSGYFQAHNKRIKEAIKSELQ